MFLTYPKENVKVEIVNSDIRDYHHRIDANKEIVEKEIGNIQGIIEVIVQRYSIWVKKSIMFEWEEIEPEIIDYIRNLSNKNL